VSDLVAFLTARLDEDQWIAEGAARTGVIAPHCGEWLPVHFGQGGFDARVDDHLARHDPARVLRETEAKRKILDTVVPLIDQMAERIESEWGHDPRSDPWQLEKILAAVWSDHEGFRDEWRA
jgi:hypothetical protein